MLLMREAERNNADDNNRRYNVSVRRTLVRGLLMRLPVPLLGLIITHKLTNPTQKQKLRGKEKRKRKEGSRWRAGRNKKSDRPNLEIAG
jgi:hypothetical protein